MFAMMHEHVFGVKGELASTASSRRSGPKRTGSSTGSPVSAAVAADRRARLVLAEQPRVQRDRRHLGRRRAGSDIRSCSSTSSGSGRIGCPG